MNCKEAMSMIQPFIDQDLDAEQTEAFLSHVLNCKECLEELEIYYTVLIGVQRLDQLHTRATLNLTDALKDRLWEARRKVLLHNAWITAKYSLTTLAVTAVIAALILQLHLL